MFKTAILLKIIIWTWKKFYVTGEGGRLPWRFLKIEKNTLISGKKGPDSVHLWVKYSIENEVLKMSRRTNSKIFPAVPFFLVFLTKFLSQCSYSAKTPLPWKVSSCVPVMILRRSHRRRSVKKLFLDIVQNSQENTWLRPAS